jgi:hypothetical protein
MELKDFLESGCDSEISEGRIVTLTGTSRNIPGGIVVRVAGLPTSTLEGLRYERTWTHLKQVLALRRWLHAEGTALSEVFYGLIGEASQPRLKPVLVALRRAVFTGRRPGPRAWSPAVAQVLPSEVADRIRVWLERLERLGKLETALPGVLEAELVVKCEVLRAAVATDVFRFGLVQGSPVLADQLRKWLEAPQEAVPERQVLLGLAKYLFRVVAKTSPYATFTLVGAGRWSMEGPALVPADADVWRSVVDLNGWVTQHLARLPVARSEFVDRLAVRVNPSMRRDGAKLWFFGHEPGEPLRGVTANDAVRECLEFMRTTPGATVGALCEHLGGRGDDSRPDQQHDSRQHDGRQEDRARALLGRLIALGLLESVMPFPDQAIDPLGRLLTWLAVVDHADDDADAAQSGQTRSWSRALRDLDGYLRAYQGLATCEERATQHELIQAKLTDLFASDSEPDSGHPAQPAGGFVLPRKNLTDENAVLTGRAHECGLEHWRPVLADLDTVRLLSGLFIQDLQIRLAAAEFFAATYGGASKVGFLDFYRTVRAVAGPDVVAAAGGPQLLAFLRGGQGNLPPGDRRLEVIEQLSGLRRQTVQLLRAHPADDRGVITVDPAVVAQAARDWPAWVRTPGSTAYHVQALLDSEGTLRLVLNGVATGYGSSRGRLDYLLDRAEQEGRTLGTVTDGIKTGAVPVDVGGLVGDPVLVDVRGLFGSNLNRRPPLARYELDYPGVASDLPAHRRIGLADLMVRFDAAQGLLQLVCPHLGVEVRPVHLGGMAEFLLPPALRLLVAVFGDQATPVRPTWRLYTDPDPWPEAGVRVLPRVELGRVTVARAAWYLRGAQLPWRNKGEPDAAYALRLIERLEDQGIPQRCYARVITEEAWQQGPMAVGKARKPIYLDQANWLSLTVFERALEYRNDRVVFHEALPDLAQALDYPGQGARVTEYVIEVPVVGHE